MNKIVKIARTWIGTPYQHQARVKHIGVDCAMLIAEVWIEAGLLKSENLKIPNYSKQWHLHNREEKLKQLLLDNGFSEIPLSKSKIGDVLGFKYGRVMSHLAIKSGRNTIIQASTQNNMVSESEYEDMKPNLITAFRYQK